MKASGRDVCHICGRKVSFGASFISIGPSDQIDPSKPRSLRWIPVDEEIHGWSPFVVAHPMCFAEAEGFETVIGLVDESHRFMRKMLPS